MSRFTRKVRIAVLRSMEALGTSAANLASNAKLRVQELTLETRRREILSDFSLQAFELWQKGVALPPPLGDMLTELSDIDSRLSVLRAQKYAKLNLDGSGKASHPNKVDTAANDALTLPEDEFLFDADDGAEEAETIAELIAEEGTFPETDSDETPTADDTVLPDADDDAEEEETAAEQTAEEETYPETDADDAPTAQRPANL